MLIREIRLYADSQGFFLPLPPPPLLIVDIELSHVIFLVMLTLFGIGIFRVDKQE